MGSTRDIEYFECACSSRDHLLTVELDEFFAHDKFPLISKEVVIYTSMFEYRGFFRRLYEGLKFAFLGRRGMLSWDTTILKEEDVVRLENILQRRKRI